MINLYYVEVVIKLNLQDQQLQHNQPVVGSTLSPQMQKEAEDYLASLKREKFFVFTLKQNNQEVDSLFEDRSSSTTNQQAESMDLPMDLTMCVAPANECNCCNCILNDEACKIIGDVNDPTSLAAMILNGVETAKDTFDLPKEDDCSVEDMDQTVSG